MVIRPGLERIARLLKDVPLRWRAIHISGTNGKGSTSNFLSGMLHASGLKTGRFNSPHLIDRWDCIAVNERPISKQAFDQASETVLARDRERSIGATEFEVLTATAFEVFGREKVDVAVVECGMGGLLDATNIIEAPALTIITRIGLDHQGFLGDTTAEIATHKAGIIKAGAPCVVDATSDPEAIQAVRRVAREKGIELHLVTDPARPSSADQDRQCLTQLQENFHRRAVLGMDERPMQRVQTHKINMALAIRAYTLAMAVLPNLQVPADPAGLVRLISDKNRPQGRFQPIDLSRLCGATSVECVLDGAHNVQAWHDLLRHVDLAVRTAEAPAITWIVACSVGKDAQSMFGGIPGSDTVILTRFGPVDGMPWVQAMAPESIMPWRLEESPERTFISNTLLEALQTLGARQPGGLNGRVVIAGSLYLASDVLRLLRDAELK